MLQFTQAEKTQLQNLFLQLAHYDNPPGSKQAITKFTANYLRALCPFVQIDKDKNIFARLPGKGQPLILSAHLDSVEPIKQKKSWRLIYLKFSGVRF